MRVPAAIAALSLRFIQEPLTLYRARAGRRVQSGRWAAGGFDEVQTVGVVVPQGEIRETLPGGLRARAVQDFYLRGKHAVRPIVEGQSGGDAIGHKGRTYQVTAVSRWKNFTVATATERIIPEVHGQN